MVFFLLWVVAIHLVASAPHHRLRQYGNRVITLDINKEEQEHLQYESCTSNGSLIHFSAADDYCISEVVDGDVRVWRSDGNVICKSVVMIPPKYGNVKSVNIVDEGGMIVARVFLRDGVWEERFSGPDMVQEKREIGSYTSSTTNLELLELDINNEHLGTYANINMIKVTEDLTTTLYKSGYNSVFFIFREGNDIIWLSESGFFEYLILSRYKDVVLVQFTVYEIRGLNKKCFAKIGRKWEPVDDLSYVDYWFMYMPLIVVDINEISEAIVVNNRKVDDSETKSWLSYRGVIIGRITDGEEVLWRYEADKSNIFIRLDIYEINQKKVCTILSKQTRGPYEEIFYIKGVKWNRCQLNDMKATDVGLKFKAEFNAALSKGTGCNIITSTSFGPSSYEVFVPIAGYDIVAVYDNKKFLWKTGVKKDKKCLRILKYMAPQIDVLQLDIEELPGVMKYMYFMKDRRVLEFHSINQREFHYFITNMVMVPNNSETASGLQHPKTLPVIKEEIEEAVEPILNS